MLKKTVIREPIQTGLGPVADQWMTKMFVGQDGNDAIFVQKVVEPLTGTVKDYIMPYIYVGLIMYLFLVLILLYIVYTLHKKHSVSYYPTQPNWYRRGV